MLLFKSANQQCLSHVALRILWFARHDTIINCGTYLGTEPVSEAGANIKLVGFIQDLFNRQLVGVALLVLDLKTNRFKVLK